MQSIHMTGLDHFIRITLWDWDLIGKDDFLGQIEIFLIEYRNEVGEAVDQWYDLDGVKHGKVRMWFKLEVEESESGSESASESGSILKGVRRATNLETLDIG